MKIILSRIVLLCKELILYSVDLLMPKSKSRKKVVIFAQGRTGSTLLENLICSTKYFNGYAELLSGQNVKTIFPLRYLLGYSKWHRRKHFIFHLKIYHLMTDRKAPCDPSKFLNDLQSRGWYIIHLSRQNKIKHAISSEIVEQRRGEYHKYDSKKEKYNLKLDIEKFEKNIETRIFYDNQEKLALKGIRSLELIYETDLESHCEHQKTVDKIMKFLSLESKPVNTAMHKINSNSIEDSIINFEELVALLKRRNWVQYLN